MPSPTVGIEPSCAVELCRLEFGYTASPILAGLSLAVPRGAFVSLLGPSGCGKTTLLKLIAGYLTPTAGQIKLHGREVVREPVERRNIGFVFQNYALFPHLTARGNVEFPLRVRAVHSAEVRQRAEAMLDRVRMPQAERDRFPAQLSGGQQQRLALARALVYQPDLLLLDEPFANLDRQLRMELREELTQLQREFGTTTILVTHEYEEALAVSDHVGVLLAGQVRQFATPQELYRCPQTVEIARAVGEVNLLPGELFGRTPGRTVLIRPEKFHRGKMLHGHIAAIQFHGPGLLVTVLGQGFRLLWRTLDCSELSTDDSITLGVDPNDIWEFPNS